MPPLSPSDALRLLKKQLEEGRQISASDTPAKTRWQNTTRELISQAFGSESSNAKEFKRLPMSVIGAHDRGRSNLERQLTVVESCIEQLEALTDTMAASSNNGQQKEIQRLRALLAEYGNRPAEDESPDTDALRTEILELYGRVQRVLVANGFQTRSATMGNLPVVETAVSTDPSLKDEAGHCLHDVVPALDVVIGRLKSGSSGQVPPTVSNQSSDSQNKPLAELVANARKHPVITLAVGAITLVLATIAATWCVFEKVVYQPKIDALSLDHTATPTLASRIPDEITECPKGSELTGTIGTTQWCGYKDDDDNFVKHGPYRKWHPGCTPDTKLAVHSARFGHSPSNVITSTAEIRSCVLQHEQVYEHGNQHGESQRYHANGQAADFRTYSHGELNGTHHVWDRDGNKLSEISWVNDSRHGHAVLWHPNGRKKEEGRYVDGEKEGGWTEWDGAGVVVGVVKYERGVEVSRKQPAANP